jgi:ATP-dependent protease ClpP protease subunit
MPTWHSLLNEIKERGSTFDVVRRERLKTLAERTGRNVIVYYSGWLQKPKAPGIQVSDADKSGFMTVIHGLDRSKGLDLLLHTPGGETAATESLVGYLRAMFDHNIRAIVPELAMSAGTMIACACSEIVMGKHSSLGPIDPQFGGIAAHGVVEEFNRAHREIKADQTRAFVWQPIIAKYSPTLIGECEKAIQWSNEMAKEWLVTGMLKDDPKRDEKAQHIVEELGDHALTKSHARHISAKRCKDIGLNVTRLEDDQQLQDAVLSVHNAAMLTLAGTGAFKIIENQNGVAMISVAQQVVLQAPTQSPLLEP